ncbi:hypothetical protein [Devosia sp.]|uniref:hypothetical protein n=1 Tax=Devosia sp. TaxID=1871048 RepID=UPI003BA9F4BA
MMLHRTASSLAIALVLCSHAQAADGGLAVELNALKPDTDNCRVTFLATNGLTAELGKVTLEIALFDASGAIDRLVSLDFKALAPGKTKVMQFALAGLACESVSRVLINNVTACEGDGIDPGACLEGLRTTSRVKPEFGG